MSTPTSFTAEISRLKKLVIIKMLIRILMISLAIFLSVFAIAMGIERAGIANISGRGSFYAVAYGISLFFAWLYALAKRASFTNILIDVDRRLKLQDRISTAYEYARLGKKSELSDLLIEDAGRRLSRLRTRQIFPPKFSVPHLLLIGLILTNLVLVSLDWGITHTGEGREKSIMIRTTLQNYISERNTVSETKKKKAPNPIYNELEHITKKLDEGSFTPDKLSTSLNNVLKEIQAEQTRLAKDLAAKLKANNIKDINLQKILESEVLSLADLKKLEMMFDQRFHGRIPDAFNLDIANLAEHLNLEQLLSQIIDDLDEAQSGDGDLAESNPDENKMTARAKNFRDPDHFHAKGTKNGPTSSNIESNKKNTTEQSKSGPTMDTAGDSEADFGFEDGVYSTAGDAKSSGLKGSPYELQPAKGPVLQDKVSSARRQDYSVHVRALASIGEVKVKEEEIIRTYRQEVESILQKEDIPLNYREYIKNYFILIGLKSEEEANDSPR